MTIREIIEAQIEADGGRGDLDVAALEAALIAREDNMADVIRLAGAQFGAFSEFVAEVLAQAGLGTPPTTEARALMHSQFHRRMAWLQEQFRQEGGPDTNGSDV